VSQREDRDSGSSRRQRVGVFQGLLKASSASPVGATGGRRYRLRPSVEPLAVGDQLYLLRPGSEDLTIRGPDHSDFVLLELLSRFELTAEELGARSDLDDDTLRVKLDALEAAGVVVPSASSPPLDAIDAERFSRQLPYLSEFGDERDLQRRLMTARLAVLGCGGLGTWTLAALAASGVRHFRLADDDSVELSNLNRQATYRPDQVGRLKVDAAAEWLSGFDSRVEVDVVPIAVNGVSSARRFVRDVDAVVLTADEPPFLLARWINTACYDAGVPFVTAGQVPPTVRIGPFYVPGETGCFVCHESAVRARSIAYDRYVEHVQVVPIRSATLGPASAIVGSILAMEIVHLLVGVEPATKGSALSVDLRTLEVRREAAPRDHSCTVCRPV
jgi:bacteriocin biosynthesis cyclodehydratase domain-containing protein